MLSSIHFSNFKALTNFSISLKSFNVLTGPNNNGKSTILDGIRVLQAAHRFASRYNPKLIDSPYGSAQFGYEIPASSIPITLENIQTNFDTLVPSVIKYRFTGSKILSIYFHPEHPIYLFFETPNRSPRTAGAFRTEFPINIAVVPTLGPLEIEEELLDSDYVKRAYGSRRSPRMFRSYWYYNPENFDEFKQLVETTWYGMSIGRPELKGSFSNELMMFCEENRMSREICWAGFGFQIWLQLLTHIINSKKADLIIVDEPEIYLHPDLQHKILDILKNTDANIVIATHSVEIINTVEPTEVLLIDKSSSSAQRISDLEGLQDVSNILGSGQNIQLTRLARGKKILFVEGKDLKLLNRLAKVCKLDNLFTIGGITVIPIDGFSQHDRIIHTNWAFTRILSEELKIAVLLDRDYKTDEEIQEVMDKLREEVSYAHILSKKEIENYFIIPSAIENAIKQKISERLASRTISETPEIDINRVLLQLTESMKTDTFSQVVAHKTKRVLNNKGIDTSTVIKEATSRFEESWIDLSFRLSVISGKSFFTILNKYLQENYRLTITYAQIANYITSDNLDTEIRDFLTQINEIRNS